MGYDTAEFDERLRDRLRNTMRERGVPDAEIEARLALHADDSLQAARDYSRNAAAAPAPSLQIATGTPVQSMDEAMAEFRAAGIVAAAQQPGEPPAHGLAANERPSPGPAARVAGA